LQERLLLTSWLLLVAQVAVAALVVEVLVQGVIEHPLEHLGVVHPQNLN
jgi:hypothetical protein